MSHTLQALPQNVLFLPPVHQFPYEQEELLLSQNQYRNPRETGKILNNLLGYAILSEKGSLINSKARVREISSVLTRVLIEIGSGSRELEQLSAICCEILDQNQTYDELCEKLQQMASFFMQCIQSPGPLSGSHAAVCRARGYIARHYAGRLTLQETADYVHLNPSYFSSVFKKTSGLSFKEHLNQVRIQRSRQLLAETNYGILDIAIASGFDDQSYFTKIFRRITGQTPKQFRAAIDPPSASL